jgi:hypothetical protein
MAGPGIQVYLLDLGEPGKDPAGNLRYLVNSKSSGAKEAHVQPFLSPDGTMGFFNLDEPGILQA